MIGNNQSDYGDSLRELKPSSKPVRIIRNYMGPFRVTASSGLLPEQSMRGSLSLNRCANV